jgi:nucleoid DNA-binding protein
MSAKTSSHSHQLIAKAFNQKATANSVDNVAKIWTAFGKFVSKTLKQGKGVAIPKFGNFTFTHAKVDLGGSTNPDRRDLQIREPIFQISKDFVLGMPIKAGCVHDNGVLRPFEIKGTSGVVPKVRVNFTEIGYYAGVSKEDAKHGCDIVVRDLSDKVKSGRSTQLLVPNIGTFICKGKVAGIKFSSDVVEQSKGKTNKAHFVGRLFSSGVNRDNLDILDQKVSQGIRTRPANLGNHHNRMPIVGKHDNTIAVTPGAATWLKNNFGVNLENGEATDSQYKATKPRMRRTFSARPGFKNDKSETASINSEFYPQQFQEGGFNEMTGDQGINIPSNTKNRRPMSAYSGASRRSRASSVKSAASVVPKMLRATALTYCSKVATKSVLDQVKLSKFNARDKLTPSEILTVLQNAGIYMDIATVRGFLSHLGFQAHGKSCSILDLIRKCKEWNSKARPSTAIPASSKPQQPTLSNANELVAQIRDCLYRLGKTNQEIFNTG